MRRALLVTIACAGWLGCNTLLGNESATFVPLDGGPATVDDGGAPGIAEGGAETAPPDAAIEAMACDESKLRGDPSNCGRCGRSCGGTLCDEGVCQAARVAFDVDRPFAIALDDTHVYWNTTKGTLMRAAKAGGAPEVVYKGPPSTLDTHFTVQDGFVYFSLDPGIAGPPEPNGSVVRCPVTGCGASPELLIAGVDQPRLVEIRGGTLLLVETGFVASGLGWCPLATCKVSGSVKWLDTDSPTFAALDGTDLAWTTASPSYAVFAKRGAAASGRVAEGGLLPREVRFHDSDLIFADASKGLIAVPREGGTTRPLTTEPVGSVAHFAIDGDEVFFTERRADGRVRRCRTGGCAGGGEILATRQATPQTVAVDRQFVYWTTRGAIGEAFGEVLRVPR